MNQYHIYEKIGKGKHSTVYKGRKKKTIQYHAIKSVDKSQKPRVLQEVRTMHALDHRNILKFYAWYETTNHLWLILEYCVGGDLMSLLRQDVRLPEASIHDFGRDMVVALQFLHTHSIIYCDIKPSNILLDENGRLKLGGFGLSRRLSDINKTPITNLPPAKRGTPCYMAPELFSEGSTHSTASDLWSLGCVLYECATGSPPFMDSSFNQLVQDILGKEPGAINGASAEFSHLLYRLLDKNPATRIKWSELVEHPFWKIKLPLLPLPAEPALEAFVRLHRLAPSGGEGPAAASEAVRSLRESVDLSRLSRIALSNLERDDGVSDYTAAQPASAGGDITIDSADAELDFEEAAEEGAADEEAAAVPPSAGAPDDHSMGDQPSKAAAPGGSGTLAQQQQQQQQASLGGRARCAGAPATVPGPAGPAAAAAAAAGGEGSTPAAGSGSQQQHHGQHQQQQPYVSVHSSTVPAGTAAGNSWGGTHNSSSSSSRDAAGSTGAGAAASSGGAGSSSSSQEARTSALLGLIWHASDCGVKPIVANRRIERLPEPTWDPALLDFEPLTLAQMLNSDQAELEAFLTNVYRTIASSAHVKHKINLLAYFEGLCSDTASANVLINSSLTVLFVRMLRSGKVPALRVRLASVLGLLVRHATFIAEELAGTRLVDILTEALGDANERVRRRVMATLGELLFYVATQQQDGGGASVADTSLAWGIGADTIAGVTRLLRPGEDEVTQHYAVKTIENICSQGGEWAGKFASQDVLAGLVGIYTGSGTENVKATAASTLSRLLRSSPHLLPVFLGTWGPPLLLRGLTDSSSSKVQVAGLNLLNLALSQPDAAAAGTSHPGQQGQQGHHLAAALEAVQEPLMGALSGLLDHSLPLLRAKAVVCVMLLCRLSPVWLLRCCQHKLVLHMERLTRDRDTYTQDAVALLQQELSASVRVICARIDECFATLYSSQQQQQQQPPSSSPATSSNAGTGAVLAAQDYLYVVLTLVSSPAFRPAVVDGGLVQALASYLAASTCDEGLAQLSQQEEAGMAALRASLLQVLEAVSQPEHMAAFPGAYLGHLVPALCGAISSSGASAPDTRFFCLRVMSDCLAIFLTSPDVQQQQQQQQQAGSVAGLLDGLLREHVVPLVPVLLQQEDPMPLYALKLLGGILDVDPAYVAVVEALQLSACFFEFLTLEHPNNNVHNIRLCRQLVLAGCLDHEQLLELQAADKVCAVLAYAQHNSIEPFLEPVLLLAHAMMARDAADLAAGASRGELLGAFAGRLGCCLELCGHGDAGVALAASQCVAQLVAAFPDAAGAQLLSSEGAGLLASVLQGPGTPSGGSSGGAQLSGMDDATGGSSGGAPPPPAMQHHLLSAVNSALAATSPSLCAGSAELAALLGVLRALEGSDDAGVASAAAAAAEAMGGSVAGGMAA